MNAERIDRLAAALYAKAADISDTDEAALAFAASDPQVRNPYRAAAAAAEAAAPVLLVHADAHFRMGSAHEAEGTPCQDYAVAQPDAALPFAVVSDGCSTSGRTDVGARILSLAARTLLRGAEARGLDEFRRALLPAVLSPARALGLGANDLDATLGVVQALPGGGARAMLFGDGYVAARTPDGLEVAAVDWAGNMPGYPAYFLAPARLQAFLAESAAAAGRDGRAPCLVRRWRIGADGGAAEAAVEERSAEDGLKGLCVEWGAGADVVAVMTDGVAQVAGAGWADVVGEFTAVKAARRGAFATRRMSRALAQFAKRGCRPVDDVSIGALAADAAE